MVALLVLLALAGTGAAHGSGLAIPEQGAAALSMSAAMTARSQDLSAIFYNPAGLDYVEGTEGYLGITPILPAHTFLAGGNSLDAESQIFLPPQLYVARRMSKSMVAGLGVFAPFGLGTDWEKTWNGRYTATNAAVQCFHLNPTLAYQISDKITLGVGASYVYSTAVIEKMADAGLQLFGAQRQFDAAMQAANPAHIPIANPALVANPTYDSAFKLDGSGSGFGFNLGLMVRPMPGLQLGASYRAATELEYDGDATFKHSTATVTLPNPGAPGTTMTVPANAALAARMPAKQNGTATLNLPWMLNLGAMYEISPRWDASVDLDLVGWSVYEELAVDFEDDLPLDKQVIEKNWENTFVGRLGTSYDATDALTVRGGVLYDQSPVPDGTYDGQLPCSDRIGVSLGAGYSFGQITLDAGYMYLSFADRAKDNLVGYSDANGDGLVNAVDQATLNALAGGAYPVANGDFENSAHLLSLAVRYAF